MKKASLLTLLLSFCLLMSSCGSPSPSGETSPGGGDPGSGDDAYVLTVACFFAAGGPYETEILAPLNEMLQEKSGGRLSLELYMGGQLMAAGDTFDSVATGMADIGVSYMATVPGRYPVSAITELPLEFASAQSVTYALNEFLGEEPPAEFDGLKVLMFYASGPAALMSQRPIETMEDMHGIQIRVNSNLVDEFNALGATPVTMSMSDTYEGLRTGVVDAYIAGVYGDATGHSVEFGGDGVESLTIPQRQSIATMCAEINAEFAIFPCDSRLRAYLSARGDREIDAVAPDLDAVYADVREIDLSALVPYVSKPHFIPNNCVPVSELAGLPVDQVVVGSCSNGRIEDLQIVADMVAGKHVAPGVRFLITPASQRIYLQAVRSGLVERLVAAGCVVTNATCGCCYGGHMGLIGPGERCLSTTTRNFKGRLGSPDSEILLCGPATAAASALTGVLTDPRTML